MGEKIVKRQVKICVEKVCISWKSARAQAHTQKWLSRMPAGERSPLPSPVPCPLTLKTCPWHPWGAQKQSEGVEETEVRGLSLQAPRQHGYARRAVCAPPSSSVLLCIVLCLMPSASGLRTAPPGRAPRSCSVCGGSPMCLHLALCN